MKNDVLSVTDHFEQAKCQAESLKFDKNREIVKTRGSHS